MAKVKKFGTFSGVFTPSILTILGVIMYLRLPWIIGQAGLLYTLGIVIVAHIISSTTGLSVASIATDKKVETGGTYYMISRSLGLPIGGTLGLALFVGLSFSVSLYLIGFAESFLGFWGWEITKTSIRLAGTAILLFVTTITFISTSLAIKSQYFIMAAIALSLISILFGNHEYVPVKPHIEPIKDVAPFMILFGIFFPAVTGFEAGVSMSGDLQDPKKSLPVGAIMAIVVGLLAYIGLTFFFSYTVTPEMLLDKTVLFKISLVPAFVVAGIWGATLSSALGSILGAPRILQATAIDKITPKVFAKGFGAANEPRNALILTFVIAEAGILIGELDVIARVVSMFFITTYGFLNLSCAIESWASSDFRPDFKIPKIISIIGALACFVVMIQLDFVALIGATIILGLIFIYLKRKELVLEKGDTWQSVWATMVRSGLFNLSQRKQEVRNWRPNILLFSGGEKVRPYLRDFGKYVIGRLGILSDFNLVETEKDKVIAKPQSGELTTIPERGIFTKQYNCRDVYEAIDMISTVYGFAGIEPNTVLMGWAKKTENPSKFVNLIKKLSDSDYNVLFLDYDKDRGFGNKKQIDIWWRGAGSNLSFALSLARFMVSTGQWRGAAVRILVINNVNQLTDKIYANLNRILEEARISGKVKIINNNVEKRSPAEIITSESQTADLTILGISETRNQNPQRYIQSANELNNRLGTVLMIHSSAFFEDYQVGIERKLPKQMEKSEAIDIQSLKPDTSILKNETLEKRVLKIWEEGSEIISAFVANAIEIVETENLEFIKRFAELINRDLVSLLTTFDEYEDNYRRKKVLSKAHNDFLFRTKRLFNDFNQNVLNNEYEILETAIKSFTLKWKKYIESAPEEIVIHYGKDDFKAKKTDNFRIKFFKVRKRLRAQFFKIQTTNEIKYRKFLSYYLNSMRQEHLAKQLNEFGVNNCLSFGNLRKLVAVTGEAFQKVEKQLEVNENIMELIQNEVNEIESLVESIIKNKENVSENLVENFHRSYSNDLSHMAKDFSAISIKKIIKSRKNAQKKALLAASDNESFAQLWLHNIRLFINTAQLDAYILALKNRIDAIVEKGISSTYEKIENHVFNRVNKLNGQIQKYYDVDDISKFKLDFNEKLNLYLDKQFDELYDEIKLIINELPEQIGIVDETFIEQIEKSNFYEADAINLSLKKIADYHIDADFFTPILNKLTKADRQISESAHKIREIVSITNFNIQNIDVLASYDVKNESKNTSLKNAEERISTIVNQISEVQTELGAYIQKYLQMAYEPINSYAIIRSSGELAGHIREQKSKRFFRKFGKLTLHINHFFKNIVTKILYSRSEGVLLANKLITETANETTIEAILDIIQDISPDEKIMKTLPFYYKNLFAGKSGISDDFWLGRVHELAKAARCIKWHREGRQGAILITGERHAGKTALSVKVAQKNFHKDKIFFVNPLREGSVDLDDFSNQLKRALKQNENTDIETIPTGAAIIINDLELWWERSEQGLDVINKIIEYIIKYSANTLFIINCSSVAYKFISETSKIGDYFLSQISITPFDSEGLKKALLQRHETSGVKFKWRNTHEDNFSEWKYARLFNAFFDFSKGNIGVAHNTWLASITHYDDNEIKIAPPKLPTGNITDSIQNDWLVVLVNFMLHRRLSFERLERIMQTDSEKLKTIILSLLRAGLIIEYDKDIYALNQYIEPLIYDELKEKEVVF